MTALSRAEPYRSERRTLIVPASSYGNWTVLSELPCAAGGKRMLHCRCSCGTERGVSLNSLRRGDTKRCLACRPVKHGQSRNRTYLLVNIAKHRAKKAGIEFTITWRDVIVPDVCPLLGIPLRFSSQRFHPNNPSIDRLDPSKGYTPDNVWVVSWRANAIKHDATLEELEALVAGLRTKLEARP